MCELKHYLEGPNSDENIVEFKDLIEATIRLLQSKNKKEKELFVELEGLSDAEKELQQLVFTVKVGQVVTVMQRLLQKIQNKKN